MVFLSNACLGGLFVLTPTYSQITFGQKVGSDLYGLYWTCFAIANFIQYFYVSVLLPHIGFNGVFYIVLGMATAVIPLIYIFPITHNWMNKL